VESRGLAVNLARCPTGHRNDCHDCRARAA
jgi:hypothetical protein